MNIADILIVLAVAALIAIAIFSRVRSRKKGCGGCCDACQRGCGGKSQRAQGEG